MRRLGVVAALLALNACATVSGSAVRTDGSAPSAPLAANEAVRVAALRVPSSAVQVGIAQAKGIGSLEDLLTEFAKQVRSVGGNFGKVDSIQTKYEMQTRMETYTYDCGTAQARATCYGSRTVTEEMATTQVLGRAFRVSSL